MPVYESAGFRFHTLGSIAPIGTKTLIISSHGIQTGATFKRPYPTTIQFASKKGSLLVADLKKAISGDVTATDLAKTGAAEDDYKLDYYEHDPSDSQIDALLKANADVLTFKEEYTDSVNVTLSFVLKCLSTWNYLYPGILCLFCRGQVRSLRPLVDGKRYAPTFVGKSSPSVVQSNMHQINATAIALELKAKGLVH
jgi:hypothetical protein